MIKLIKKIYKRVGKENKVAFEIDIEKQLEYLKKLNEPKNDYEQSFNQYKCQQFLLPTYEKIFKNLISIIINPILILIGFIRRSSADFEKNVDAIYVQNGISKEIIPNTIKKKYREIKTLSFSEGFCLDSKEIRIVLNIFRLYPLSPYFSLKILLKLSLYCYIIKKYKPKAIITYCETSYSCAIITYYCELFNIKHINIQHGDFLKRITFSYFRFSEFYVWDQFYIDLFTSLKCINTKYIIEYPEMLLKLKKIESNDHNAVYDLTYYLSNEDYDTLINIRGILIKLKMQGKLCKIRVHPRETDLKLALYIFKDFFVEIPKDVSLLESLNTTQKACALCSTVLYQAEISGKGVVIDDCSNKAQFEQLKKVDYIMLKKNHEVLSSLLN